MNKIAMNHMMMLGECMIELTQGSEPGNFKQSFAGDVFNTGIYIKRCLNQASEVSFLSVIGEDAMSDQLLSLMADEQLETNLLYRSKANKMGLYVVNVDDHGERSFSYWRENSAARQLMKFIKQEPNKDVLAAVGTVFFSGISIAILSENDLAEFWAFIKSLKSTGCQVVFDPNYRPVLWSSPQAARDAFAIAYSLSDTVLPGVDDHIELYDQQTANEVASHLESIGIKEIIIKNGEQGVLISVDGERIQIDITPVDKVVDTTSAGDAFNGGYLSARHQGKSVEDAVNYAASVAGCVIQHKGAIVPKSSFNATIAALA